MPRAEGGYESFESDTDAENEGNKNVGWIKSRGMGVFYLLAIAVCYLVVFLAIPEKPALVASIVNGAHAVITFFALHYQRGSVIWTDSGEFDDLTFWQQLDGGFAWTANKKLLMLFPLILSFILEVLYQLSYRSLRI